MFKLSASATFERVVKVLIPVDGGHRQEDFKATFRVLPVDEANKFDLSTPEQSTDFLKAIIVKLDDIAGDDGEATPYSDEVRDAVLRLPFTRGPIVEAYFAGITGARSGN